ncbi:MAG: hypothetical protein LBG70_02830 [Bifidobacteriaceae bacterium]|jgi:hypothetical protein|nr:hypothetical protein [Bifidobacteriaceae bacterium]
MRQIVRTCLAVVLTGALVSGTVAAVAEETPTPSASATTPTPDASAPSTTVPAPSITTTTFKGNKTGKITIEADYSLPVLSGGPEAGRALFTKRIDALVAAAEQSLSKAAPCKKTTTTAKYANGWLKITAQAAVYAGQYASAGLVIERARPYCANRDFGTVSSITVDLDHAKTLKLTDFALDNGQQFDAAIAKSLPSNNPTCKKKALRKVAPPLRTPNGWMVSPTGVTVWFNGVKAFGTCPVVVGKVPWSAVLKPSDVKGQKTVTTYWVRHLKETDASRFGYTGQIAVVQQRGNQVVVFTRDLSKLSAQCQVGIRSNNKAVTWRAGKPWSKQVITLTSAKSDAIPKSIKRLYKKASKAQIKDVFKAANGLSLKQILSNNCHL